MTLEELKAELAEGNVRALYLLVGPEPLLRDDAVAAIRTAVLPEGSEDFNLDRLDGASTSPATLHDAVRTLPVLAPRRLVILREPVPTRGGNKALVQALTEVAPLLAGREPRDVVLVVVAGQVDRRARWVKDFDEVSCSPPRAGRDLVRWVRGEAERQGVALESGAAELFAERTGPQLLMLRQEIAKASLLAGEGEPVARAHVVAGTCDVAEEPIWDLTDAIGEGRAADALAVLAKLRRAQAPPPVLLGSLGAHFRRLLRTCSGGSVAGPPFVQRKLKSQARRYTQARLLACLRAIHETDTALKGAGALRPDLALERLVIGLSA